MQNFHKNMEILLWRSDRRALQGTTHKLLPGVFWDKGNKNNQGQEREILWGLLYGMLHDELLISNKNLQNF